MAIEIERKFLVVSDAYKEQARSKELLIQGFLNTHPERTIRVRLSGNFAYLTIKGRSNESGTSRYEWEKEIGPEEAQQLLLLCEEGIIEKTRHTIAIEEHIYEVDEFHRDNKGLVVCEIELESEDEQFERPAWLGKEVTGKVKYYNSKLIKNPYTTWNK